MKKWAVTSFFGLFLVAGFLWARPDLKGWTPPNWNEPATKVTPTSARDAPFFVSDCLPGTIVAHGIPSGEDRAGTASMTVFTCRSRSSAITIMLIYLMAVLAVPALRVVMGARGVQH